MKFILNLLLFISLFFNNILLASSSAIQSGIYGTNFKDSLLSNISSSTGNYLFKKAGDIGLITNSKDGSLTKTALHSLVGGSINAIQGESFLDGAIISGINELLTPLSSNLNKDEQILTSQLTGILTGALINSEAGAKQGYNLTTNAEMYNRQLHKDEIEFIKEKAQEFAIENGISKDEAISRLSSQALRQTDNLWSLMLGNEDIKAKEFLSNTNLTFKNGNKLFTADRLDYKNNRLYFDTAMNNIDFYNAYIHPNISSLPLETVKNNTLNLVYNADKIPSYVYNLAKEQTPSTLLHLGKELVKNIFIDGASGTQNLIRNMSNNDLAKLEKVYGYEGVSDDIALISGLDTINLVGLTGFTKDIAKNSTNKISHKINKSIDGSINGIADNFSKIPPRDVVDLGKVIKNKTNKIDNKINHVFNKKDHKLDKFLENFQNNPKQAYDVTIDALKEEISAGKLPNNFTNGYKINVDGFEIEVRGVIKNGKPEIGTMFIP